MNTDRIEKQVVLRAPLERVWRAVSDAEEFGRWFGVRIDGNMHLHAALTAGFDTYGLIHTKPQDGLFLSQADASLSGTFAAALDFNPFRRKRCLVEAPARCEREY